MCKIYIILSLNKPNPKAESIERGGGLLVSTFKVRRKSFTLSLVGIKGVFKEVVTLTTLFKGLRSCR